MKNIMLLIAIVLFINLYSCTPEVIEESLTTEQRDTIGEGNNDPDEDVD